MSQNIWGFQSLLRGVTHFLFKAKVNKSLKYFVNWISYLFNQHESLSPTYSPIYYIL